MAQVFSTGSTVIIFPTLLKVGHTKITVTFDVTNHTTFENKVSVSLEASSDNGITWQSLGGFSRDGGVILNKITALPETVASVELSWLPALSQAGQLKATINVVGAPLVSTLDIVEA